MIARGDEAPKLVNAAADSGMMPRKSASAVPGYLE